VVLSLPSGSFEVVCETTPTYHEWGDYTPHIVKLDANLQEVWRIDDTQKPRLIAARTRCDLSFLDFHPVFWYNFSLWISLFNTG
jgi:hypothetical protein